MIPNVRQALKSLQVATSYQVIRKVVQDHEVVESEAYRDSVLMVVQPQKAQELVVKPEGQRRWRWFNGWSESKLELDWTIIDDRGHRFRIMSVTDWSQGGFYYYELVQGPAELEARGS